MREISPAIFIGDLDGLCAISEDDGVISIGAGVTYTEAFSMLAKRIPALGPLFDRIGGDQVRNMGTIGGNIANGSPIGDTPPPLIALGARLTLRQRQQAADDPARRFLHRLWQAGPAAGRVRRGGACAGAGAGIPNSPSTRSPSAVTRTSPQRLAHSSDPGQGRHGGGDPHRLWRHGGDAEAGFRRGSGAARQALDGGDGRGGHGRVRQGFHAADRHARLGRIPGAGGEEPAAALLRRDQRHQGADAGIAHEAA